MLERSHLVLEFLLKMRRHLLICLTHFLAQGGHVLGDISRVDIPGDLLLETISERVTWRSWGDFRRFLHDDYRLFCLRRAWFFALNLPQELFDFVAEFVFQGARLLRASRDYSAWLRNSWLRLWLLAFIQ